ncbi:MAG: aminomethyl transferase family protein, partial [Gammaproteobacteria bacterium]
PAARALLREHTALDLADEAFPYLGIRETLVAGAPCRIMRVGFVGELGYEIHLPAEYAVDVWRALLASGSRRQIQPFGVEAQRMLRLEKGHIIVGQDTDGVTNAWEIDAPWALKMDKPFFIGQRSLRIVEKQPRRQTLVGFSLPPQAPRRPKECHLVIAEGQIAGRVTSVGWSPTLAHCIGLALVTPPLATGRQLRIRIEAGEEISADIVRPPFYDPKGERQHVGDPGESAAQGSPAGASLAISPRRAPLEAWFRRSLPEAAARDGAALRFEVLSRRERFGCKGPGAEAWLNASGYRVPPAPNSVVVDTGGVLVARLATAEFLVEAVDGGSERLEATRRQLGSSARPREVYPVARQDLVIGIGGARTNSLLRQICSVDFTPLLETCAADSGPVILTSMIGVAAVAFVRRSPERGPVLTLWIDPSFAHYFWTNLLEAGRDLGGVLINE